MAEANADMIEGFKDGYDRDCPDPSDNRSRSYRHGFLCGRADINGKTAFASFADSCRAADLAMALDGAEQPLPTAKDDQ
jgi:hypothetical protein